MSSGRRAEILPYATCYCFFEYYDAEPTSTMTPDKDSVPAGYDGRRTLQAFGLALLMLAGTELAFRAIAPRMSGNLIHIRDFDRLLSDFELAPGPRAVFIGNSLMNKGVDHVQFADLASAVKGRRFEAIKLAPDGTTLWDWRCVIDRLPPARQGDLLILGYAWYQIADQQTVSVSRTFGLLCPLTELPKMTQFHDLSLGDWMEAGLSRLSLTYVLRERLSNGILASVVPHYETEVQRMNDKARDVPASSVSVTRARTYASLTASLQRARVLGYRAVIVAMPTLNDYAVDPELERVLAALGVEYLDFRKEPWLHASLFDDSVHLGSEGARQLTSRIAAAVFDDARALAGN